MDRKTSGFTLIELLIVMGIVATLIMVLAPTVPKIVDMAKVKVTESMLGNLGTGLEQYKRTYGSYPSDRMIWVNNRYVESGLGAGAGEPTGANSLYLALQGPHGEGWKDFGNSGDEGIMEFGPMFAAEGGNVGYPQSGGAMSFLDSWGKAVLYLKSRPKQGVPQGAISVTANWNSALGLNRNRYFWSRQWPANESIGENYGNITTYQWHPMWLKDHTQAIRNDVYFGVNSSSYVLRSAGQDRRYGFWLWDDEYEGYVLAPLTTDPTHADLYKSDDIVNY